MKENPALLAEIQVDGLRPDLLFFVGNSVLLAECLPYGFRFNLTSIQTVFLRS